MAYIKSCLLLSFSVRHEFLRRLMFYNIFLYIFMCFFLKIEALKRDIGVHIYIYIFFCAFCWNKKTINCVIDTKNKCGVHILFLLPTKPPPDWRPTSWKALQLPVPGTDPFLPFFAVDIRSPACCPVSDWREETRASNEGWTKVSEDFTITDKVPTRAFSLLLV